MGILFSNEDEVFSRITEQISKGSREGMENACLIVEHDAKEDCPVNDGILRQSITHSVELEGNNFVGYIGTNIEYAPYVHQGTGIYAAEGNGRKEVPWHYKDRQGNWHSTKGIKPTPFIYNSIEKNKERIANAIQEGVEL